MQCSIFQMLLLKKSKRFLNMHVHVIYACSNNFLFFVPNTYMFTGAVFAVFSYRLTTFSYNSAIVSLCQFLLKHIRLYDCLWRSQFQTTLHQKHEKQILSNIIKSSQEIQCTLFKNASNNSVENHLKLLGIIF